MTCHNSKIHPHAARLEKFRTTALSLRVLAILLVLPVVVIVMRATVWEVPRILTNLLVVDACLILVFASAHIVIALEELRGGLIPRPIPSLQSGAACALIPAVREEELDLLLQRSGYRYSRVHSQGVRLSRTTAAALCQILCGFLLLIPTGAYDYLYQFSGLTYLGIGDPISMSDMRNYGFYSQGALAEHEDIRYKLKGFPNVPPSAGFPEGGKELAVLDPAGKELWHGTLVPGSRHQEGKYLFHFHHFVYDVFLSITTTSDHFLIGEYVRLRVMNRPDGPYTHHGVFYNDAVKAEAWLDPRTENVRVRAIIKGKAIEAIVGMGPAYRKEVDGHVIKNNGIGHWSQINVLRVRHIGLMKAGGILLAVGIFLFLFFPVRRVWIMRDGAALRLLSRDQKLCRSVAAFFGDNS